VVLPTDTVYGIGCRADDDETVRRLFAAKGRPDEKALPVLVPGAAGLTAVCADVSPEFLALAARFWPGPLTIVVRKTSGLSGLVTGAGATVGVRVPDCLVARQVLAACPFPVAVSSANLSGEAAAQHADDLPVGLRQRVDLILDAGPCPGGRPSTVLDLTTSPARVLRTGPVTAAELQNVLGREVVEA
jgi:L-threonylcarbamoyladenylate synthase